MGLSVRVRARRDIKPTLRALSHIGTRQFRCLELILLTVITHNGVTYNRPKFTMSNSSELYFLRWGMQIVSMCPFPRSLVIVSTQMNFGALYAALVIHTPRITSCEQNLQSNNYIGNVNKQYFNMNSGRWWVPELIFTPSFATPFNDFAESPCLLTLSCVTHQF